MDLIINHTSMEPIYEQIMIQIKAGIIEGTLTAGEALPSVRALSRELKLYCKYKSGASDGREAQGAGEGTRGSRPKGTGRRAD